MAVTFQSAGSIEWINTHESKTVNVGSTIATGDLLIFGMVGNTSQTLALGTTGWTYLRTNVLVEHYMSIAWKIADAQENGTTGISVDPDSNVGGRFVMARYTGHATSSPISIETYGSSSGASVALASMTFPNALGMIVGFTTYQQGSGSATTTDDNGNVTVTEDSDGGAGGEVEKIQLWHAVWDGGGTSPTVFTVDRGNTTGGMQVDAFYIETLPVNASPSAGVLSLTSSVPAVAVHNDSNIPVSAVPLTASTPAPTVNTQEFASYTNTTKNAATVTNTTKNAATATNTTKHDATVTNTPKTQ